MNKNESMFRAIRALMQAVDEIILSNGLPSNDEDHGNSSLTTVLDLAKQFARSRASEAELVSAIEAISPLFPALNVAWK
jgi:hypothetical protein